MVSRLGGITLFLVAQYLECFSYLHRSFLFSLDSLAQLPDEMLICCFSTRKKLDNYLKLFDHNVKWILHPIQSRHNCISFFY